MVIDNGKVYIIILNYNGYEDTLECLQSLISLDYPNFDVIVCDNASPNGSEKYIREWIAKTRFKHVHFIQTGKNLGFAGGNNVGIRYAMMHGAQYIWLLNNDTTVEPDALTAMVEQMQKEKSIGICGSKLISYHDKTKIAGLGGWYNPVFGTSGHIMNEKELSENLSYIIGASMLFRREVFERVGLLQDDYFLYYEELDIAERIKKYYKMTVALNSIVYHKEGASIGNGSAFSEYYLIKNNLKFTWRFHRIYFPIVAIRLMAKIFYPIHRRPYKRLEMFCKVTQSFIKEVKSDKFYSIPQ